MPVYSYTTIYEIILVKDLEEKKETISSGNIEHVNLKILSQNKKIAT